MSPLRLLAIIEATTITGPAKNLLQFAALARAQAVETVIATFTRGASTNLFIETARAQEIQVETVAEGSVYDPRVLRQLSGLVDRLQPHIVQTHAVKSHFLARCAGLPRRAPWIAVHHGYTWPALRARVYNQLDRWSLRAARQVLTVSLAFRQELIERGVRPERITVVHNAIAPGWASEARGPAAAALRSEWGIPENRKVILMVGRLSREKDPGTLLEAVRGLPARLEAHLLIVGDGPERGNLEERIRAARFAGRCTLTGQQSSAEPFYGIADIAVLSSLSEGSPNALLEAMAAGLPVVATRVGGVPEIAAHEETALLVEPGDPSAMRAALGRLLQDPGWARQLGERGQSRIARHHSPQARVDQLIGIYHSCAGL